MRHKLACILHPASLSIHYLFVSVIIIFDKNPKYSLLSSSWNCHGIAYFPANFTHFIRVTFIQNNNKMYMCLVPVSMNQMHLRRDFRNCFAWFFFLLFFIAINIHMPTFYFLWWMAFAQTDVINRRKKKKQMHLFL